MNTARKAIVFLLAFGIIFSFAPPVFALSVTARISDQYAEVIAGDRLYFEVEVKYPENSRRKDLRLTYTIVQNKEAVAGAKVLKAVETQASFLDYIVIPKSVKSGVAELTVTIEDYENLHKEVSASFKVLKGRDQLQTYFFILLGAMALVASLVVIQIVAANRRVDGLP